MHYSIVVEQREIKTDFSERSKQIPSYCARHTDTIVNQITETERVFECDLIAGVPRAPPAVAILFRTTFVGEK